IVLTTRNELASEVLIAQQQHQVKGVVTDTKGEPVIGANVMQQGTTNGTITNVNGEFTLNVPADATLTVSYVGYQPVTVKVNGQTSLHIQMQEDALTLETVVVTAMGIKKKAASLTYSTQQVNGDELTRAKDPNLITALAGKTSGVQITKSANLGGSSKVAIRGARSAYATGNNQPLYVIDGVPMLNNSTESSGTVIGGASDGINRDAGDGISNLNPDDIESMSILKGASASALYGSQAANGVILITTKTGKAGMHRITFSSNLTIDQAINMPEFQNSYGRNADGGTGSWGAKGAQKDYDLPGEYFGNGVTAINSLSISTGNERMQTYFSYANTTARGIVDNNVMQKHNLNLHETASLFNDRLKLDGNATLMMQNLKNSPSTGGYYLNPLVSLYSFPRGVDMSPYRNQFEILNSDRNMMAQNWIEKNADGTVSEWSQNPYWLRNRVLSTNKRYRAMGSVSASLKITDWLSLQARGNVDYTNDKFENQMYATTAPNVAGQYNGKENGRYVWSNEQNFQVYGDVMAMFNKDFNGFSVNGALGASINQSTLNSLFLDSHLASLYKPNVFVVANIPMTSKAVSQQTIDAKRTLQSVFATAQLGWKEMLYLDLTVRNDWSSTLAYTDSKKSGFFYPSVGLTWLINKTVALPEWINFAKLRGSYAEVGNDLPLGITNPVDILGAGGTVSMNDTEQRGDLKPERSKSVEFGAEFRFFHDRFGIDFTWYQTNTINQLLRMDNPSGSAYKYRYINAGKIRNQGIELTVDATPVMNDNFRWKTAFNMSANRNKVVSLHPDYTQFSYYGEGFSAAYQMRIVEGGKLGDIYGNAFARDESGKIVTDETDPNKPMGNSGNKDLLGNTNPDFLLGWGNTLTYKNFNLYFLIDCRFGGKVMSLTQSELDARGVTPATADARDRGYVEYQGQRFNDPQTFFASVGGRNGISEYYMYSATNIRLRELSLSYSFPTSLLDKTHFIKGLDVSLIARNLFFFKNDAPFDPDAILSVGNNNQGVDVFGMPTTRNIGFNLKFTF
ncbi:MAG: TonB-dependent receptor, partial [Mediterranea sp.]|nr:TonB-dependent receptor [Mediterranea sp.]